MKTFAFLKNALSLQSAMIKERKRGSSSVVEHDLAKVGVAGSNPVSRSFFLTFFKVALVAELVDALDLKSRGHS